MSAKGKGIVRPRIKRHIDEVGGTKPPTGKVRAAGRRRARLARKARRKQRGKA
jgi:hypothetical protein